MAPEAEPSDEAPPFLGAWGRIYAAVLVYLGVLILGFYLFAQAFR